MLQFELSLYFTVQVFSCFATPSVTYIPMETEVSTGPSVYDSMKLAFDDVETADVRFVVDNKEIHAHKAVLKIRCEHFRSMFQDHWEEGTVEDKGCVDIRHFSYPVYRAFLLYLYTDQASTASTLPSWVDILPKDIGKGSGKIRIFLKEISAEYIELCKR